MSKMKFIQIAINHNGYLYALDAQGDVWLFNTKMERWEIQTDTRYEGANV